MGDIPPPTALYPAPPQQSGNMLSDPGRAIGMLNGINQLKLFNAQYPALAETPTANLQSIKQQQQMQARQTISSAYANAVRGLGSNASEDDVRNVGVNLSRSFPDIATTYPDMIPAAKDTILNTRKGNIQAGANTLLNSTLTPAEGTGRTEYMDQNGVRRSLPNTAANIHGSLPTGLPPNTEAAEAARNADLQKEGTYGTEINNLNQAYRLAKDLPHGDFGPNSDRVNDVKARLVQAGWLSQKQADEAGSYLELNKYIQRSIQDRANAIAPHTNEGLEGSFKATPNTMMTKEAFMPLLRQAISVRNMEHASVIVSDKNASLGQYPREKANFGNRQDPNAFGVATMEPGEVTKLYQSLKADKDKSKLARFNASLSDAERAGIWKRPNGPQ
jgi:hypothetical protein